MFQREQPRHIDLAYIGNGRFETRIPGAQDTEILDTNEDFLANLYGFVRLIALDEKIDSIRISSPIIDIPTTIYSQLREFLILSGAPMSGRDFSNDSNWKDLGNSETRVEQFVFTDGPLDGKPIPKYGWHDDRLIQYEEINRRFEIYGRRSDENYTDFVYLGSMDSAPNFLYTLPVNTKRSRSRREGGETFLYNYVQQSPDRAIVLAKIETFTSKLVCVPVLQSISLEDWLRAIDWAETGARPMPDQMRMNVYPGLFKFDFGRVAE